MQGVAKLVLNLIRVVLATILLASVLLICANAFGRYVLWKPIIWAEEVLGYALVWMVYLGAVIVTAERQHLKMDLLSKALGPTFDKVTDLLAALVFVAVGGLIIYQSYFSIREFTHRSQVADLPMNVLHLVIPVSFALMVIATLALAISDFARRGKGPLDTADGQKGDAA
jgi:TRAP-type C4-dicarboxylate transport system permease small subunit